MKLLEGIGGNKRKPTNDASPVPKAARGSEAASPASKAATMETDEPVKMDTDGALGDAASVDPDQVGI
jgi:hypothetical protein